MILYQIIQNFFKRIVEKKIRKLNKSETVKKKITYSCKIFVSVNCGYPKSTNSSSSSYIITKLSLILSSSSSLKYSVNTCSEWITSKSWHVLNQNTQEEFMFFILKKFCMQEVDPTWLYNIIKCEICKRLGFLL